MPTILDSYYGTAQSYLKQEHVHLLRYNDRLLERLNAVEAYHSLPLSKWHSLAGKPTEHGIPHYMITSDQGDEYIRDRVDYIRSEAGVPAFPWFSVPASNQYWGRSWQSAKSILPMVELSEAIGRITSLTASVNRYTVTIFWNGTTYHTVPQVSKTNLGSLPESDPLRRIQYFQVDSLCRNWRRAPRLIQSSLGGDPVPATSEYEWYLAKNGLWGTGYDIGIDVDTEDPDTFLNKYAAYVRGEIYDYSHLVPPAYHKALAKHWDYGDELTFFWEDNPQAQKQLTFPIWIHDSEAPEESALTALELAYQGSGAWTTDSGTIPTGGTAILTEIQNESYRVRYGGQVRAYYYGGSTIVDNGVNAHAGTSTPIPLPESEFEVRGSDTVPNSFEDFDGGTVDSGTYRWLWPTDLVNIKDSGLIVPFQGLSPNYAAFKADVDAGVAAWEAAAAEGSGNTAFIQGGYEERYYEKLRKEYTGIEEDATWLYWLEPRLVDIAQRPA